MTNMVDLMYADYEEKMTREEQEKERSEDNAQSTPSSEHSSFSSYSHHLNEEINHTLQAENVELTRKRGEEEITASVMSHGRGLEKFEAQRRLSEAIITYFKTKNQGK